MNRQKQINLINAYFLFFICYSGLFKIWTATLNCQVCVGEPIEKYILCTYCKLFKEVRPKVVKLPNKPLYTSAFPSSGEHGSKNE